jgi:hypothetical protein
VSISAAIRVTSNPPPDTPKRPTSRSHPPASANSPVREPTGTAPPTASCRIADTAAARPVRASAAARASRSVVPNGGGTTVIGSRTGAAATVSAPDPYPIEMPATVTAAAIVTPAGGVEMGRVAATVIATPPPRVSPLPVVAMPTDHGPSLTTSSIGSAPRARRQVRTAPLTGGSAVRPSVVAAEPRTPGSRAASQPAASVWIEVSASA